ncbi:MAG: PAS domain S-box protein [Candidatus Electrothrix sp. AR4]|nr:PAS domain S-box protein [Candidatus Electrothrix sp. AR4]
MKSASNNLKRPWRLSGIFFKILSLPFWVIFNLAVIGACFAETPQVVKKTPRILFINSYHPGYSWSDEIERGVLERFAESGKKVDFYVEYLDTRRFTDQKLQEKTADIIHSKYQQFDHDLIIVSDNAAFDFSIKNRERLFPNTPVVFCGYNNFRPKILHGLTDISGVNEEINVASLVETAIFIQPNLKNLVFILSTGEASSSVISKHVEASIAPIYKKQYEVVLLKDVSVYQIRETLSRLRGESALFLVGQTSDMGKGRALTPVENGRLISDASPIPAYTLWNFHLGTGVLGGRIVTGYDQGVAAGKIALQILSGEKAENIPVVMESPTSYIFDYNVMERFDIAVHSLPKNSAVINKPHSLYEEYREVVWVAIIVFTLLSTLLIMLLVNILHRYRAEKELKKHRDHLETIVELRTVELRKLNCGLADSEARFRSLSDASFEGIFFSEQGRIIDCNSTVYDIFGYDTSELIGKLATNFVVPEQREDVMRKILSSYEDPYEAECVKKDGTPFTAEVHGRMFLYHGRLVRVTAIRDITAQKKADAEIKTLRGILPICMHCKGIRDDKGYWNQLENYITEHSEAQFSHGVCEKCVKKHYPELID